MSTFGVIVSTRGFFPVHLAETGRREILKKLAEMGHGAVILSEGDTRYGAVETREDAKKCARLFRENKDRIDGILVILPNFGDEIGVVSAVDMSKLDVPVLVQACDDDLDKMDVNNRRDAFCGKLSVCSNLNQYGIRYTDTALHTCSIDSEEFTRDIGYFSRVCNVVKGIRKARIGAIGARPAAFQTVRFSEKLLQASGISTCVVDLSEIIFAAKKLEVTQEVQNRIKELKSYGRIPEYIKEDKIERQAKLSVTLENWIKTNECDAGAVQCWDSLEINYGCAPCVTMSMLGETGIPCACEMDVTGALTMYALLLASGKPAAYLDWNNNYGNDRNKCINTHCSSFPGSFFGCEFEVSNLDVLGKSLGADKCFGACKANVDAGPMTFAKITTDDISGKIKVYVGEGEFTGEPAEIAGGAAVCKIHDLQKLMKYISGNGFEHHVAMNRSNCADILEEALGKYLGWDVYRHS